MKKTLNQLPIGHTAVVKEIMTDPITKERLESLGIIEGVAVDAIRETPLGCPRIYRALNTLITVRNNVAKKIIIEEGELG
ncbi:MAG TPA: FeoA family protein [Bacillota bacterium]